MITLKNYAGKTANAITDIRPLCTSVKSTGKALIGVGATALSILTGGTIPAVNKKANDVVYSRLIFQKTYHYFLNVVNPDNVFKYSRIHPGIFFNAIIEPLYNVVEDQIKSESFLSKQIFSRVVSLLAIPVIIITSIADNALGLIAAAFSLFPCFGRVEKINKFVKDQLFCGLGYVFLALRVVINPSQFRN